MNDLNSQEQDTCFSAQELPFVSRLISLVDKSVCPKAKRKFLELTPILSFITKNIFYKCLVLNMCVYFRKLLLMALSIYMFILCQKKPKKKTHQKPNPPSPPPKKNLKTKNKVTSTRISFFKQYFIWFIFAAKSDLVINKCVISDERLIHLCDIISLLFGEWFFFCCNSNIFLYSTGFDKLVPCMNSGTVQRLFFEDLLFTGLAFMDVFSRNGSLPCQ